MGSSSDTTPLGPPLTFPLARLAAQSDLNNSTIMDTSCPPALGPSLLPFPGWRNWDPEEARYLPEQTQLPGGRGGTGTRSARRPSPRPSRGPASAGRKAPKPGADRFGTRRCLLFLRLSAQASTRCLKGEGRCTLKRAEKESSRGGLPSKQMRQKPEGGQGGRKAGGWAASLPGLLGRL